jgi:antitoxin CcdA
MAERCVSSCPRHPGRRNSEGTSALLLVCGRITLDAQGKPQLIEIACQRSLKWVSYAHPKCAWESVMQETLYNANAPKKSTNLSINSDLLRQAKDYRINLSKALEQRLVEMLIEEKRREWKEENREAIEAYNRRIEAGGVFSDGLRRF